MKSTGHYDWTTDDFDLQGEIDKKIDALKKNLEDLGGFTLSERKETIKAMIDYLVELL